MLSQSPATACTPTTLDASESPPGTSTSLRPTYRSVRRLLSATSASPHFIRQSGILGGSSATRSCRLCVLWNKNSGATGLGSNSSPVGQQHAHTLCSAPSCAARDLLNASGDAPHKLSSPPTGPVLQRRAGLLQRLGLRTRTCASASGVVVTVTSPTLSGSLRCLGMQQLLKVAGQHKVGPPGGFRRLAGRRIRLAVPSVINLPGRLNCTTCSAESHSMPQSYDRGPGLRVRGESLWSARRSCSGRERLVERSCSGLRPHRSRPASSPPERRVTSLRFTSRARRYLAQEKWIRRHADGRRGGERR